MKAIGYVRVSTEEQAKEGISLENQKDRIRGYSKYEESEISDIVINILRGLILEKNSVNIYKASGATRKGSATERGDAAVPDSVKTG